MSNRKSLLVLSLACLFSQLSVAQGVQTLDEYVAMQRAALAPPKPVVAVPGIGVADTNGSRIGLVTPSGVRVPGVDSSMSSSSGSSSTGRVKVESAETVQPRLPRIYGIMISPNAPPLAVASPEYGGSEFMVPSGESIPNSAWRIFSINTQTKIVSVQLLSGNAMCAASSKKKCASPAIIEVRL